MDQVKKYMMNFIPSANLSKAGVGDSSLSQCVW
jgi:hypothetical protein